MQKDKEIKRRNKNKKLKEGNKRKNWFGGFKLKWKQIAKIIGDTLTI